VERLTKVISLTLLSQFQLFLRISHSEVWCRIHFLSHSFILARQSKPRNCVLTGRSMEQMLLLDPMDPTGLGHRNPALKRVRLKSLDPLLAKRSTTKGCTWIRSPAKTLLPCSMKGHPVIRLPTLPRRLLTVYNRIKFHMDLQADKSPVVVKGPFSLKWWTEGIESVEQCAMQEFNLVKQGKLSYEEPNCI
jgi:hypothetical protein